MVTHLKADAFCLVTCERAAELNYTINTYLIKAELVIKYMWMFNMSDLSKELWSTEKSYTFSLKILL